jgi:hypothetical protein
VELVATARRQAHEPTNGRRDPPLHSATEPHQAERPILSRAPRAVLSEIDPRAAEPIRPA